MIRRSLLLAMLMACTACNPVLDWREVRPAGSGLTVLLPCKPASHTRPVTLAGAPTRMTLVACSAGDATWAVAFADLSDPTRITAALSELRASAAGKLSASASRRAGSPVKGSTPNTEAGRLALDGRYPDGRSAQMETVVFARGTSVFQATAVGERLDAASTETFFMSLQFQP